MNRRIRFFSVLLTMLCLLGPALGQAAEEPVAEAAAPEVKPWDASIALGFNLTSGNSDTVLFTLAYRAKKEWEKDVWSLGADAAYGENDGDKNNEKAGAFADYQRLLTERLYVSLHLEALHDSIANLEWRFNIGPSLGYYFIKSDRTKLSAEAGPTWVIEKTDVEHTNQPEFLDPPANTIGNPEYITSETQDYVALRIAERFDHQLNERAKIWQSVEILPQVDDWDNYLVNFEIGVEAALNSSLSLRVVAQDKYDNQPPAGSKSNDIALITALVYKFK